MSNAQQSDQDSIPAWDHPASIRPRDGDGVFSDFTDIQRGTLAEMIYIASHFHREELDELVVQITGGRRLEPYEILALAKRPDFPDTARPAT